MANRAYKFQEFVAHSRSIRCVRIGKKARRLLLTGGDDHTVNVWRVGKPSPSTSLSGHVSSVECVAFDSEENFVLAGASSGAVKLWDLQHSKLLRNLTGHKLKCTAVDFHPFGDLFGSGSGGKNLKLWDVRKKGCIQTYKAHTAGINTLKFTPDGRWLVSGGLDNAVKLWDLTAGKLLHEFNVHDGPIRSIEFHPLEFLLATGSEDGTVKFWDLETFEMIGSTRTEAAGVRAMSFHPDGRTLFCGYDENLKVHSWEPIVCHDSINMEWSTLGDLSIHEQRLLGCSYYRNSLAIWAADLSLIKPYGTSTILEENCPLEQKACIQESDSRSSVGSRSMSPDVDMKRIKNIYVDYEKPINSKKAAIPPLTIVKTQMDRKVLNKLPPKKNIPPVAMSPNHVKHLISKSFVKSSTILKEISEIKDFDSLRIEPFGAVRESARVPTSSSHSRTASDIVYDTKRPLLIESRSLNSGNETVSDGLASEVTSKESVEEKFPVEDKLKQDVLPLSVNPTPKTGAVNHGRTRSLVEKFEKWDKPIISKEDNKPVETDTSSEVLNERVNNSNLVASFSINQYKPIISKENKPVETDTSSKVLNERVNNSNLVASFSINQYKPIISKEDNKPVEIDTPSEVLNERVNSSNLVSEEPQISGRELSSPNDDNIIEDLMQSHDIVLSDLRYRLIKLQMVKSFWERNDFKGVINMMNKFPDHFVKADVISIFMEKMEIITLDLFSSLLPILLTLLDSQTERHAKMSLEMLLKLVAVFGEMISSAISAPLLLGGVDLHQEERIKCCRDCFEQLQRLQTKLDEITRRSALLAKLGSELNLILKLHNIS